MSIRVLRIFKAGEMMKNLVLKCSVIAVTILWAGAAYAKHPAEGHPIDGFWVEGSRFPSAELNQGDMTFMEEEDYPDYDALTQLEQYMMFGVKSSDLSEDKGLAPYKTTVVSLVCMFYAEYGYVPDELTPEIIRMIPGKEEKTEEQLSVERNPLTGEWTKLKVIEHSPGDFYIRALTEDEIDFFVDNGYRYLREPSNGNAERYTPVLYVRMYGYDCVLSTGFKFFAHHKN